ncbi:hypothetical protein LOAG_06122 [Loa loa]|uniref:Uncharacterized protein n=1 Tax=Loa loa TaxID=7209 RepID=A0A1S0TYK5_LOALO|nr:hypothetical protein LOAG_06122 [Loa loa]EFO22365.1 hypothetical protein LOAG_06122 [Loa loa]
MAALSPLFQSFAADFIHPSFHLIPVTLYLPDLKKRNNYGKPNTALFLNFYYIGNAFLRRDFIANHNCASLSMPLIVPEKESINSGWP